MGKKVPEFIDPPAVIGEKLHLRMTLPADITGDSSFEDVKTDDISQITNLLQLLYISLGAARDVETIVKISTTVTKLLVERRKLLCMQYGSRDSKKFSDGRTYTVPD